MKITLIIQRATIAIAILASISIQSVFSSTPTSISESDARIEELTKKTYVYRKHLKDDHVEVKSENGIVTLSGHVSDESDKSLVEETVKNLPGVKTVNNQLEIKGEKVPEKSDEWLKTKIKVSYLIHPSVSSTESEVLVKEGVVTLKGTAKDKAQKDLYTRYAKDIDGVKSVKNEMTISATDESSKSSKTKDSTILESLKEEVDDASITAQVKWALLTHKSTSALRTKVEAENGIVTLSGEAKTDSEKKLVTELVNDIHGVKKVINKMTVGT